MSLIIFKVFLIKWLVPVFIYSLVRTYSVARLLHTFLLCQIVNANAVFFQNLGVKIDLFLQTLLHFILFLNLKQQVLNDFFLLLDVLLQLPDLLTDFYFKVATIAFLAFISPLMFFFWL